MVCTVQKIFIAIRRPLITSEFMWNAIGGTSSGYGGCMLERFVCTYTRFHSLVNLKCICFSKYCAHGSSLEHHQT
jgi:hypothetical protein